MKLYEYCIQSNLLGLTDERRLFVSKLITREVQIYAHKKNISPEDAYFEFSHGLTESSQRELPDEIYEEADMLHNSD